MPRYAMGYSIFVRTTLSPRSQILVMLDKWPLCKGVDVLKAKAASRNEEFHRSGYRRAGAEASCLHHKEGEKAKCLEAKNFEGDGNPLH